MSDARGAEPFVKRGSRHGPDFFRHEAAGLAWLAAAPGGPRVVEVLGVDDDEITLETISAGRATTEAARRFGRSLATMHDAGAAAWGAPAEGWAGRCFIGNRPQECRPTGSWGEFYAEQRVRPFVAIAVDMGVLGGADLAVIERACDRIAAGELDHPGDEPARVHGDLWTGNVLWAPASSAAGTGAVEAVLIDPAAHGGHRETDLAMLALFGAPHLAEILRGYQERHPLREGWQQRVPLHQLHPLATHSAGHGAGYAVALADAARQVLRL
ncbi:fructosamine kinase family protein [Dietzia psychralcaliphila]|uniref:Fructosamine kinase n=1 Tax=Dietzia psychralcaliphila TaxID=139021 RepID=A0AAD0JRM6_9ACTN|nr:fructosamine kinase family protein [Dietzia psychralcaliphila]AWH96620.1 fructosamine kinase [Dietzia psychralcaliphila]PTM89220.1 fructosamine-3-kinase [Dietzia psychralcaliphila]